MLIRVWPSLKGLLSKWIGDTSIVDVSAPTQYTCTCTCMYSVALVCDRAKLWLLFHSTETALLALATVLLTKVDCLPRYDHYNYLF